MKEGSNSYLTFVLGEEKFAIPVSYVQEVVEYGQVTKVPNAPDYLLGIINLRGRVLPLIDTKLKLGLSASSRSKKNRIVVLDIHNGDDEEFQMAALVDLAREVLEIQDDEIQVPPDFEDLKTNAPITGLVNHQGDITMIMDLTKVFSMNEITGIDIIHH